MNDERSGSAARPSEALAADSELAGFAAPAAATKRAAPADPQALTHREKRLIAISMMLPVFLGSVDQSVLASALPTIGRDLGQVHNLHGWSRLFSSPRLHSLRFTASLPMSTAAVPPC